MTSDNRLTVGGTGNGANRTVPGVGDASRIERGAVPGAEHAVGAAGKQSAAVRCERHGVDFVGGPRVFQLQHGDLLAGRGVPDAGLVPAGGQPHAVRRIGEDTDPARVAGHLADLLAGHGVPDADSVVESAGNDQLAVGGKADRIRLRRMASRRRHQLLRIQVEDIKFVTAHRQVAAIGRYGERIAILVFEKLHDPHASLRIPYAYTVAGAGANDPFAVGRKLVRETKQPVAKPHCAVARQRSVRQGVAEPIGAWLRGAGCYDGNESDKYGRTQSRPRSGWRIHGGSYGLEW